LDLNDIATLLKQKQSARLVSVTSSSLVADAVRTMNDAKIGAVAVVDDQNLAGILTERDILVRVVGKARDPLTTRVSEVMTSGPTTVDPATSIGNAMHLMSAQRFRHLPVVDKGKVLGLISMGDVTQWVIRSQQVQFDSAIGAVKRMGYANRRGG
jgi:CBS domain-containing protein